MRLLLDWNGGVRRCNAPHEPFLRGGSIKCTCWLPTLKRRILGEIIDYSQHCGSANGFPEALPLVAPESNYCFSVNLKFKMKSEIRAGISRYITRAIAAATHTNYPGTVNSITLAEETIQPHPAAPSGRCSESEYLESPKHT